MSILIAWALKIDYLRGQKYIINDEKVKKPKLPQNMLFSEIVKNNLQLPRFLELLMQVISLVMTSERFNPPPPSPPPSPPPQRASILNQYLNRSLAQNAIVFPDMY